MEEYLKNIGNRIKNERKKRQWLLSQLSEKSGISVAHISSIERGKYNFSVISLINISSALEIDINYLLFGEHIYLEYNDLQDIINDCNVYEASILIENARQLKDILRKNNSTDEFK